jgi:hypothetical protein
MNVLEWKVLMSASGFCNCHNISSSTIKASFFCMKVMFLNDFPVAVQGDARDALAFHQEGREQDGSVGFLDPNHPHVSSSEGH